VSRGQHNGSPRSLHTLTAHHLDVCLSVTAECNIVYVAAKNWCVLSATQYWSPVRNFHCTTGYVRSCPFDTSHMHGTILRAQKGVLWMVGMTLLEAYPSSSTFQFPLPCIIMLSKALVASKGYHVMARGGECREVHQKGRHNSWMGVWRVFRALCVVLVLIC
jgi:hypothetical protein